jgi:hypothetical protein
MESTVAGAALSIFAVLRSFQLSCEGILALNFGSILIELVISAVFAGIVPPYYPAC